VKHLLKLPALEIVSLGGTKVTKAGLALLKQRPELDVWMDEDDDD
jgi:hypothetical protein